MSEPCSDCRKKVQALEAIQSERLKWERKAMVVLSDIVSVIAKSNLTMADQLMRLIADLNRIGLAEKEAKK